MVRQDSRIGQIRAHRAGFVKVADAMLSYGAV